MRRAPRNHSRALAAHKLLGAKLAADLVEHCVHHAGLVGFDKGMRHIDVFRNDDAARHVLAMLEFVGAGAQHRAQDGVDPLQWPALRQGIVDQRIELGLIAHHARHHVAKEGGFSRQVFVAFDLATEPMALELGKDIVDSGAADVHLIERLHGREPRCTAPVGFLVGSFGGLLFLRLPVFCHDQVRASRRLIRSMANAARAASPPLSSSLARARAHACASVLTVMIPLPSGTFLATARSISAREDSMDTISKWMVSPRTTQPSAIAMAAGISSAPGTVITSWVAPAAFSSASAPSINAS